MSEQESMPDKAAFVSLKAVSANYRIKSMEGNVITDAELISVSIADPWKLGMIKNIDQKNLPWYERSVSPTVGFCIYQFLSILVILVSLAVSMSMGHRTLVALVAFWCGAIVYSRVEAKCKKLRDEMREEARRKKDGARSVDANTQLP